MEGAQVELFVLIKPRVREELDDLEFANLIGDCLAGRRSEKDGLLSRGGAIDGDNLFQIVRRLIDSEFANGRCGLPARAATLPGRRGIASERPRPPP